MNIRAVLVKKYHLWAIVALLCFQVLPLEAEEPVTLSIDNSYPPYMSGTYDRPDGLYADLIHAVFARMDHPVSVIAVPWKRALNNADMGITGIGGLYVNDSRLQKYDYSEPIYQERLSIYALPGRMDTYRGLDDLKGLQIATIKGWSYGEAFDKAKERGVFYTMSVNTNEHAMRLVFEGRVDAAIIDDTTADMIVAHNPEFSSIARATPSFVLNDAFIAFNKKGDRTELIGRFNRTLKTMRRDGSYDRIIADFIRANNLEQ